MQHVSRREEAENSVKNIFGHRVVPHGRARVVGLGAPAEAWNTEHEAHKAQVLRNLLRDMDWTPRAGLFVHFPSFLGGTSAHP